MGVFSIIGNTFESSISSFVSSTSSGVISTIAPWVLTGVTLYFLITGYMVMAGRISDSLSDILIKGSKIALVAMVGLSTGDFMNYVAGGATGLERDLLSAIGAHGNIYEVMDSSWEKGWAAVNMAFEKAGELNGLTEFSAIIMLMIAGAIGCVGLIAICSVGAAIVLMSKMALVVALGFGPLFICALMFPATAGFFDSWLRTVLNYIFTSVIIACFLVIFINIFATFINSMSIAMADSDSEGFVSGVLFHCVVILLVAVISTFACMQVPSIASSLVGGVALSAVSLTGMVGRSTTSVKSAISGTGQAASSVGRSSAAIANAASRGAVERTGQNLSSKWNNISGRYMRRNNENSIHGK